jgi:SAM-dependent MidA family methyltransferase
LLRFLIEWVAMNPARQHLLEFTSRAGILTFGEWTAEALFGDEFGYYRQVRPRVGHTHANDFATNLQHGRALAPLLYAAWSELVGEDQLRQSALYLVGEEPGQSLAMHFPENSFRAVYSLPWGVPWPEDPLRVVFANEVLDAQPFERFLWAEGRWSQMGVTVRDGAFVETVVDTPRGDGVAAIMECLPASPRTRQVLDIAPAAGSCLRGWLKGDWKGLFFTLDYGHYWETLLSEFPEGTARGYVQQRQEPNLLAAGGVGDLTCHVCWDLLQEVLGSEGFRSPEPLRQDRFFFRYGSRALQEMMVGVEPGQAPDDLLGHAKAVALPGTLGSRFHALWGVRA